MNRIENAKKSAQPYETFLAIMVAKDTEELLRLKDIAERNCKDERYSTIVFVVIDTVMGEKQYERFIEYQANAQCAQSHGLPQQHQTYTKQAAELLQEWLTRMRGSNMTFYLDSDSMTIVGSKMTSTINNTIAPHIFSAGPESLELIRTKSSTTYWKKASVKATVDAILNYNTKQDILDKCGGPARHVEFLLQYSVNENLEWKDNVSPKHPLKKVCDYVDEYLSGRHTSRNQSFNLGDKLIALTSAPYGLFQSYAPMAMVAFAMRKYRNVIYDMNGKQRTAQHLVEDVVEMFKAWESGKTSNKLNFMFESKEAGSVCKMLNRLFKLDKLKGYSDISSLKDARWAVLHEYSKIKGFPMWALKYADDLDINDNIRSFIDNLMKVLQDPESMKNPKLLDDTISGYNNYRMELGNILLDSRDNFRKGFYAYMKSVDIVNVLDNEIDAARQYLNEHLQGEVGLWTEIEVKDKLKDWRMSQKTTSSTVSTAPVGHQPYSFNDKGGAETILPNALKQKRDEAIEHLNNCPDLKKALEDFINSEDYYTIETLMRYV